MSINLCTFSGNLGGDCEVRFTPRGAAIGSFSLPVKQGYGEHEKTSWIRCILLGKKAESLPQYLKKGSKVTVIGQFVMNEWTDQQGQKRSTAEIIVQEIDLPPKPQGAQQQPMQQAYQQPNYHQAAQQQAGVAASPMAHNPTPQQYQQQQYQQQQYQQQQAQNYQQNAANPNLEGDIPF